MFNKQKNEIKEEIKDEIDKLIEDGKVLSIGILTVTTLTIGYFAGALTTSLMYRAMK